MRALEADIAKDMKRLDSMKLVDFKDCDTLYIGNLHPLLTESQLLDICSPLQTITEAKIIKDRATDRSTGCGFLRFVDHT